MRVILNGALGRMGQVVQETINSGNYDIELVAKVDINATTPNYSNLQDVNVDADVLLDFSSHLATKSIIDYAIAKEMPVVIAATGQTDEELQLIKDASNKIPVFFSGNMSLGVALLIAMAKKTAAMFKDANIKIVETHHVHKLDAPSGTAKMIAKGIKEEIGRDVEIQSIREGEIVGIHEVIVDTPSQTLTLKHEAHNRALFAEGALEAIKFIKGKEFGLYSVNDLL